jgi:hypothetical protein
MQTGFCVTLGSMKPLRHAGLITTFFVVAAVGDGQQRQGAALKHLRFLSGRWVSETPAEVQEETWTPVSGDSITGTFRIVQHGRPVFYEFWAVELDDNRPVLKLKHFNAGLDGWEERSTSIKMPLLSNSENDAVFAAADSSVSLHYHREGSKLTCTVHHVKNGHGSDEIFTMTRAPEN